MAGTICPKKEECEALCLRYPAVPVYVILKLSMIRYGAVLTPAADKRLREKDLSFNTSEAFGLSYGSGPGTDNAMPGPVLLRDASFVYINWGEAYEDPYVIDYDPETGDFYLKERDIVIDTVSFVERPAFFDKKTRRGIPMASLADVRAQKLIMTTWRKCIFRDLGMACRFCAFFSSGSGEIEVDPEDLFDVVSEAIKERGRFSEIALSGGTDLTGRPPFTQESDRYIRQWQAIGRLFRDRFPAQLMAPAYPKAMLRRIYDNTGITSYSANLEIADRERFAAYCPGKAHFVGYDTWLGRLEEAVEVFGPGNVCTQIVAGAELAGRDAFSSIEEALESNFRVCERLASNGVVFLSTIWRPHAACDLGYVPVPPLEYYVRLAEGLHAIRASYGLHSFDDDYRHCGNHPDSDMERTDYL